MSTQTINKTGTEFTLSRTLDAPLAKVWKAWTRPEHFERWFSAVPGSVELDVRPGGHWSALVQTPHGDMPLSGVYRDVVAHRRLVWTMEMPGETVVMSATFCDRGPTTDLVYGQNVAGPYTCEQAVEGSTGILDSLEQYLGELG